MATTDSAPAIERLARWATRFEPSSDDLELANRALLDTIAVALAGGENLAAGTADVLSRAGSWATCAHVLDFDDLHVPSTTHISTVVVPVVAACGGGAREYLVGAGVMARLGTALGWGHYSAGWHATCTAGAPAAAAAAATCLGLDTEGIARAMALAVPAAGGVQRAFGSDLKPLQVGFAAEAGVRAARLAAAGAGADPTVLDQWMDLVGADPTDVDDDPDGDAVPGGLAIKLYPCCYAMQRPIAAMRELLPTGAAARVERVVVTAPASTVAPLIHWDPRTGQQGKFSLPYAIAATVLDDYPGLGSFTDEAAARPAAREIMAKVQQELTPGGSGLLEGALDVEVRLGDGTLLEGSLDLPPGAPRRPPTPTEMAEKLETCRPGLGAHLAEITWDRAGELFDEAVARAGVDAGR